eukprot:TRINITY_DN10780_c0_g1_i1.p1 TRINITY_DN10780_c0_g1~~TRINITY_DN10780_c0_g1_i1.p1  ORF type:complete len:350 (+),score=49.07 TRINITY_DN10780_c0_g1_i1:203-1252(+)
MTSDIYLVVKSEMNDPAALSKLKQILDSRVDLKASAGSEWFDREFVLLELLGQGSFGRVYKAQHRALGVIVAAKEVKITQGQQQEVRVEIEILRQCKSPYIVNYFGSFLKHKELLIIMEYCPFGSVNDLMQVLHRELREDEISAICRNVLGGLHYLHSSRKIHRDIKSENILLSERAEAKLADFGVSGRVSTVKKRLKTVIGTPYFVAPEIISSEDEGYDAVVDIWSLGITCIEMAEKYPPLWDLDPMKALFIIPTRPPPTFKNPLNFSNTFCDFVSLCLTKHPAKRPTADVLLKHSFIAKNHEKNVAALKKLVQQAKAVLDIRGGLYNALQKGGQGATDSLQVFPPKL